MPALCCWPAATHRRDRLEDLVACLHASILRRRLLLLLLRAVGNGAVEGIRLGELRLLRARGEGLRRGDVVCELGLGAPQTMYDREQLEDGRTLASEFA